MTTTLNALPATQVTRARWPWIMLFSRTLLFLGWQVVIALIYLLLGSNSAWTAAAAWWPLTAILTNIVCLILLSKLFQREGRQYRDLFRIKRDTIKSDLLILFGILIISGPISFLPNPLSAQWLFGSSQAPMALFAQPLPLIALVVLMVAFPISNGLAELPTYFGYVQPRLVPQIGRIAAVLITGLMLAFQHVTLLRWRPQLMPYLVATHMLMDFSVMLFVPAASL